MARMVCALSRSFYRRRKIGLYQPGNPVCLDIALGSDLGLDGTGQPAGVSRQQWPHQFQPPSTVRCHNDTAICARAPPKKGDLLDPTGRDRVFGPGHDAPAYEEAMVCEHIDVALPPNAI
jgi:hypothetical protein